MSKEFALYLIENENEVRELNQFGDNDTRYIDGDMCVISSYFTDLKPIKPAIEIPNGDFWVLEPQEHEFMKVIGVNLGQYLVGSGYVSMAVLKRNINDGTWIICEEPKKKMRPFTDEEIEEFIYSDGWVTKGNWRSNTHISSVVYSDGKLDGVIIKDHLFSSSTLKSNFTDRHGNKFEKVAE